MIATLESKVLVNKDVVFHVVQDEAVLLNQEAGTYFGLDEVGTRMWSLLVEHGQVGRAYEQLLEEYEVDKTRLRSDLLELVSELVSQGLLVIDEV